MSQINFILFGPPGSGKGTQSEKIVTKYGLKHISTGDILRKEKQDETPLGALAARCEAEGKLMDDEIVIAMVRNFIVSNKNAKGFLFDGFPRTVVQAMALDTMLSDTGTSITRLLSLDVPRHILLARLLERGKTSNREDDKDPVIINNRLDIYEEQTLQVQSYYAKVNKVSLLNGNQDIPLVESAIDAILLHYIQPILVS